MTAVQEHVTASVPVARLRDRAEDVLSGLRGKRFDTVGVVFVLDEAGRLAGQVALTELLAVAGGSAIMTTLTQPAPTTVRPETDQEEAASVAIRENLSAVPVTDEAGKFIGAFPPKAIMSVLREEHVQDLHRLSGIWRHTKEATAALSEPPFLRMRHRLPWLFVGLMGSMLATNLVSRFESTLEQNVVLAFFIPLIVYLADAVGTQTESVAVRGLSLAGAGLRKLLVGELGTGALIGMSLAVLVGGFEMLTFGSAELAAVLAISVFSACTIATTIGLLLPWSFSRLGWDPALSSGPIATIVQDVLSLLIYLGVAAAVLGG